jgi:hypothetical protein
VNPALVIEVDGVRRTLSEWVLISGLKKGTIWYRLNQGWPKRDAVAAPLGTRQPPRHRIGRAAKHGDWVGNRRTPEWITWQAMKTRCYRSDSRHYARYGGRGIAVYDRWLGEHGYGNFLADVGRKPTPQHSIDRIDNDGDYCPENCRWATATEQNGNRSNVVPLTLHGRTQCVSAWAREVGISDAAIRARLRSGWPVERALCEPSKRRASNDNCGVHNRTGWK